MMSAARQIAQAEAATDRVLDHVAQALDQFDLFEGRIVNGWGVFTDPDRQRAALAEARRSIDAADALLAATEWPSPATYDAATNGEGRHHG